MNKFRSCYTKCVKMFLGFTKYYSVTNILLLTGLPSFDTLMINAKKSDLARWSASSTGFGKVTSSCVNVFVCFLCFVLILCLIV